MFNTFINWYVSVYGESNNSSPFLDVLLVKNNDKSEFKVYRKPTCKDTFCSHHIYIYVYTHTQRNKLYMHIIHAHYIYMYKSGETIKCAQIHCIYVFMTT